MVEPALAKSFWRKAWLALRSDFGVNGARPTNPELLDWLAAEFMRPQDTAGHGAVPGASNIFKA